MYHSVFELACVVPTHVGCTDALGHLLRDAHVVAYPRGVATRVAQRYGSELAGLVLSGPASGRLELTDQLLPCPRSPSRRS